MRSYSEIIRSSVLIDEVDMHLHPEWQQVVLRDLKHPRAFPQIQFIVTTHSPQVLSTVRKEHIRILEAGEETVPIPLARTFGETSNDVLETVMHTPFRPDLEHVRDRAHSHFPGRLDIFYNSN